MKFPNRDGLLLATVIFLVCNGTLGKSVQIHGRVLSTAIEEPLSGAELSLYPPCEQNQSKRVATRVTRNNGEYEFAGVKPGRYRLEIHRAGFATTRIFDIYLYDGMEPLLLDVGLEVGGDGVPSPERKIEGWVTDASGKPVADATITAQTLHLTGKFLQVRTNSQGRYSIRPPAFDDTIISVAKQGHQPATKVIKPRVGTSVVDFSLQPTVASESQARTGQSPPNTALQRIGPSYSCIDRLVVRPGRPLNFGR